MVFALLTIVASCLSGSSLMHASEKGVRGSVLATVNAPGARVEAANPGCILYVDHKLWQAREKPIRQFLRLHLPSSQWWPLQVWDRSLLEDGSTTSGPWCEAASRSSPTIGQVIRGVIVAADNTEKREGLVFLRKRLAKSAAWLEYHWMIMERPSDCTDEFQSTEVVIFFRSADAPSAPESRWGVPRLLNPFARPMRTTDYYGSGDANLDGTFDSRDLNYTGDILEQTRQPTERADVSGDGTVDSQDMEMMQEVLSGSRAYLPGWWDRLATREERDSWVDRMLAIDKTDRHAYEYPLFVCHNFSSALVLNNTGYDGSFHGEPSKWLTPGRFNLPMYQVILAKVSHAVTGILVGDDPLKFDSWRFIEPQSDSDAAERFDPGERIFVQVGSRFTSLGEMSSARALVIFELDEDGSPLIEYTDPELVRTRLSGVTVCQADPATRQPVKFTAKACVESVMEASVILRRAGDDLQETRVPLYDDGFHDDGVASDGIWGGSAIIDEPANILVDLKANLTGGGETTYQQASWFSTAEGRWHVCSSGSDSNPGSFAEPFETIDHAVKVAFPGDTIVIAAGVYPESPVINKGGLQISGSGGHAAEVSVLELSVAYGTRINVTGLSCGFAGTYYASSPVFAFCRIGELFESADARVDLRNCWVRRVEACDSSVLLRSSVISNPDGSGVAINCPSTSEPSLVPLEILNCTMVNSNIGISCTADDEYYPCTLRVTNCILWDNAIDIDYDYARIHPIRCDIESGWPGGGNNISIDPLFVDPDGPDDAPETCVDNDYRLAAESPCIDEGENEDWMRDAFDLDGNPRIWPGKSSMTVDMGAYEYGSRSFRIVELKKNAGGPIEVTWTSRPGDTYVIWSCLDLASGPWIEETTIPSQGQLSTWTCSDRTSTHKYYKVGMK